jgi:hypothetical protein
VDYYWYWWYKCGLFDNTGTGGINVDYYLFDNTGTGGLMWII